MARAAHGTGWPIPRHLGTLRSDTPTDQDRSAASLALVRKSAPERNSPPRLVGPLPRGQVTVEGRLPTPPLSTPFTGSSLRVAGPAPRARRGLSTPPP